MFTGFVGHRELFKGVINDLNNFKEYYLCRRNSGRKLGDLKEKLTVKWGEEGWEHVLACTTTFKKFYKSSFLSLTFKLLSQHPMFWRYCCIIVNCEVFTYKLLFAIDDFAHTTLRHIRREFCLCHAKIF